MLLVEWADIVENPEWLDHDNAVKESTHMCSTLGFYLNHDATDVRLSSTISRDQRNVIVIPLGCVRKVTKIEVTK
jgi:hypothetical protein